MKKLSARFFFAKKDQLRHNILSVSFWYTKWIMLKYFFSEFIRGKLRIKKKTVSFGPSCCSAFDHYHHLSTFVQRSWMEKKCHK